MKFIDAMEAVRNGETVKNDYDGEEYSLDGDGDIVDSDGNTPLFTPSEIVGEWEIVEDVVEDDDGHGLVWALDQVMQGYLVRRECWATGIALDETVDHRLIVRNGPHVVMTPELLLSWVIATDWVHTRTTRA